MNTLHSWRTALTVARQLDRDTTKAETSHSYRCTYCDRCLGGFR